MKNSITKNNKLLVITNIIFIFLCIVLIFIIVNLSAKRMGDNFTIVHGDKDSSFVLTNPILDCENNNQNSNSIIFSDDLNKKVENLKSQYSLTQLSVYFRDLNNGPWVGVNEKEIFTPASLLKVPILISLLHEAEDDKSILDKVVTILDSDISDKVQSNIKEGEMLAAGGQYTLSQIAESMIKKSDNTAVPVLLRNIDKDNLGNVFKTIGVPYEGISSEVDVSVKNYAGFFRVLFNSSYLNREMSEKALNIMTESNYYNGIVAGIPKGITVAHKFGERILSNLENTTQLHDCGIVYYPNKPYVLCIMTRGNDLKNQSKVIQELSRYIYNEVDKN